MFIEKIRKGIWINIYKAPYPGGLHSSESIAISGNSCKTVHECVV